MQSSNWKRLAGAACGALILGCAPASAQSGAAGSPTGLKLSNDKPIQIESDKLEVHQDQSVAIFTGNVSVVQGPTLLKSGLMKVFYVKSDKPGADKGGAPEAMTGSSNIDHIEVDDKVYIKSNDQIATGDKGTFDMKSEVLVLSGSKVVLTQGPNVLVGCKLTVQMKTGLAQVEGCGGRVQMSLTPDSQNKP
jgi:lipopolysaccharide export system protein LptA